MRRGRRSWILLTLPLLLLTACSPPDEPVVALAVRDGQPVGVLVPCGGRFGQLSVYLNHDDQGDQVNRPLIRWGVHGESTSEVVEATLLGQPPDGWEVADTVDLTAAESGVDVDVEPLTELRPGVTYTVRGSAGRDSIPVDFTLADLSRIGPDEVLAPLGRDATTVVSRKAFLRKARSSC